MSEVQVFQKRKINVVNVGGKNFTMETTANNREELEREIGTLNMGVNFRDKKLVVGETKNSLDVGGSLLPASNFTLFILPKKTKAGGESRNKVKELMQLFPIGAREHFSKDKSYTIKKETELEELLKTWEPPIAEAAAPSKKEKKTKEPKEPKAKPQKDTGIGDVVKSVESHIMTAEQYQDAKKDAKAEMADQVMLGVINEKLDRLLMFAQNQLESGAKMAVQKEVPQIADHVVYADPVNELAESEFNSKMREIQREFPDVKDY